MWRFFFATILSVLYVESRILQLDYATAPPLDDSDTMFEPKAYDIPYSINFKALEDGENDDNPHDAIKGIGDDVKKPCAIVVLSNAQNPIMHSLLRKYRYDSNGVLIPNSVKYFVKLPQGVQSSPVLMPLHDKAFSPLGGFIRLYAVESTLPEDASCRGETRVVLSSMVCLPWNSGVGSSGAGSSGAGPSGGGIGACN